MLVLFQAHDSDIEFGFEAHGGVAGAVGIELAGTHNPAVPALSASARDCLHDSPAVIIRQWRLAGF